MTNDSAGKVAIVTGSTQGLGEAIARTAEDPQARAALLQMAQVWFRLAESHAGDAARAGDAEKEPRS